MANRCMGACCTDIGLRISPEEFKMDYNNWVNQKSLGMGGKATKKTIGFKWGEVWLVYPMLTFFKKNYTHPEFPWKKQDEPIYHYKCKHFDEKKKLCTIYDERPYMCRSYPDSKKYCANPSCEWTKVCKIRPKDIKQEIKKYIKKYKEQRNEI